MWNSVEPSLMQTPTGIALFILAYATAEICLLPAIPGTILAGTLYGPILGTAVVFLGAGIGAMSVFTLSRHWLRSFAIEWIQRSKHLEALQHAVNQEGLRMLLLARLSPILPFSVLNVAYGLSDIHPVTFAFGLIGILPATFLYVGMGTAVAANSINYLVGALATIACTALLIKRMRT